MTGGAFDVHDVRQVVAVSGVGALFAVGMMVVHLTTDVTYGERTALTATTALGGGAFVIAGLVARRRQPSNRVGNLMLAVGGGWVLSGLQYSDDQVLGFAGVVGGWLWAALLAHLTLAFPSGRLAGRLERWSVAAAYVIATVGQAAWVAFADRATFRPAACVGCPGPLLSLESRPDLARSIIAGQRGVAAVVMVAVCVLMIVHWRKGSAVQRQALAPILLVGAVTGTLLAGSLGALAAGLTDIGRGLQWPAQAAALLVPVAFLGGVLRSRLERAVGVSRLVDQLDTLGSPDRLVSALGEALGDRSLEVVYWTPAAGQYIDEEGRPYTLPGVASTRMATPIDIEGRPVAALIHDAALMEEADSVHAAGRAAALWLERERLEVERRARIVELRDSRARLVEAGDAERRRIERDLHDGAQQRLVSLLLQIQLNRRAVEPRDRAIEGMMREIEGGLADALTDLRALAAGILPPVLSDCGLNAAVEELTSHSPIAVTLEGVPSERLPRRVEVAAYFVIAEALANVSKHARASRASVRVWQSDGRVVVETEDDGVGGASLAGGTGIRGLADRVGALDGRLVCHSPPGQGTLLRADIPCVW